MPCIDSVSEKREAIGVDVASVGVSGHHVEILHCCFTCEPPISSADRSAASGCKTELSMISRIVGTGIIRAIEWRKARRPDNCFISGQHVRMPEGLRVPIKYIGPSTAQTDKVALDYFESVGVSMKVSSPEATVRGAHWAAARFAALISWPQQVWTFFRCKYVYHSDFASLRKEIG